MKNKQGFVICFFKSLFSGTSIAFTSGDFVFLCILFALLKGFLGIMFSFLSRFLKQILDGKQDSAW